MKKLIFVALILSIGLTAEPARIGSKYIKKDFELTADPNASQWKTVKGVIAANGPLGKPTPGHGTEIRSRWTDKNIYFLFICPYDELYLKPDPTTEAETNLLWEWDVAEVFISADFKNIRHYREYQVSPQGEWVDLDIDRNNPLPEGGWLWNSGFKVKATIDAQKKIWYGEMQIPIESINDVNGPAQAKPGKQMRINFYRLQGPKPNRAGIAWQPTGQPSYHVPEAFGRIVLEK